MTPQPAHPISPSPRLRFIAEAAVTCDVDGVWWPRSDDLAAELPALLTFLAVRVGPIGRVGYHMDEWVCAPTGLVTDGRRVRLDGYRHACEHAVDVLAVGGTRIALRVVPQRADAARAVRIAADPDVATAIDDLVAMTVREVLSDTESVAAQYRQ
ncbi:DUF5994 family protein [Nocardia sp. CDC159]|uniref:DUF5994 family protein n=1 Tax=Nocardia pulmonis TaxID=2951408 RepID=A0A9X2IZ84_9NOCA|nr:MULTISPECIES: DUF5994 family protein [Nocardia]MCM6777233.1 DUF5994 family protein [Nocardia pulmonis]MCM6790118.1 DUF5994 family protein [Nocardia sp. CDC159]